jgi:cytoskeletal protein CcmA (bactofilin family)
MATVLTRGPALKVHLEPTYLNRTSTLTGYLFFEAAVRIDGKIDGEIIATGEVIIGESAQVAAHIQAPSVSVHGRLNGDIIAQKIELRTTARVVGNITSAVLKIDSGAVLYGRCSMPGTSLDVGTSVSKPQIAMERAPVTASIESLRQK